MTDYDPGEFLKCPNCHRATTVTFRLHADGDASFKCEACGAGAWANKLHQHDRVF